MSIAESLGAMVVQLVEARDWIALHLRGFDTGFVFFGGCFLKKINPLPGFHKKVLAGEGGVLLWRFPF